MNIDKNRFVKIAEAFHRAQSMKHVYTKSIEITAEEPFMYRDGQFGITSLISELNKRDFSIKITTNGSLISKYLHQLDNKIERLRISFHSISSESFKKITGIDCKNIVQENIIRAKGLGISVTLNRLVLENYLDDLKQYLDFVVNNGLRLKLLTPHYKFQDFVSFKHQENLLNEIVEKYILPICVSNPYITDNQMSSRKIFPLPNSASVEIRLPIKDFIYNFPYCLNCNYLSSCYQSNCLLPTSVKLTPDLKMFFCSVKNTPSIDLTALEINKWTEEELVDYLVEKLDEIGLRHDKGFYLPIRAIITSKCNFKCYFCHAEGLKRKE